MGEVVRQNGILKLAHHLFLKVLHLALNAVGLIHESSEQDTQQRVFLKAIVRRVGVVAVPFAFVFPYFEDFLYQVVNLHLYVVFFLCHGIYMFILPNFYIELVVIQ